MWHEMGEQQVRRAEQVMVRLAGDLQHLTSRMEDAMERCRELLDLQSGMPVDVQRDAQHLYARVEATSMQLENTIRTMERLSRRLSSPPIFDARKQQSQRVYVAV